MDTFNIGLSGWIIQDGNYEDYSTGEKRKFALEFNPGEIKRGKKGEKEAVLLRDSEYRIKSEIVFLNHEVWVIDFGILAFKEDKPPLGYNVGDFIETEIYLGVDPFFYFERLYKTKNIPELIYTWSIDEIKMETAPFIEQTSEYGRKYFVRDESKRNLKSVSKTDAWKDDNGNAEYVMKCTRLADSPTRKI
jgi:hypothetical protein